MHLNNSQEFSLLQKDLQKYFQFRSFSQTLSAQAKSCLQEGSLERRLRIYQLLSFHPVLSLLLLTLELLLQSFTLNHQLRLQRQYPLSPKVQLFQE